MLTLGRGQRAAEQFAALLDGTSSGPVDPGLAKLANLAGTLQSLPIGPTPAFAAGLRATLVHTAANAPAWSSGPLAPHSAPSAPAVSAAKASAAKAAAAKASATKAAAGLKVLVSGAVGHGLVGATAAAIAVTGVGAGATQSLAGDPLYGVKRAAESLQLDLTSSTLARAETQLSFARTRLAELSTLAQRSHPDAAAIAQTLRAWTTESAAGIAGLLAADSPQAHAALATYTREAATALHGVLPALPAAAAPLAQSGLSLLQNVSSQLTGTGLLGGAGTGPNTTGPNTTGPNGTGPNTTGPNGTGPNGTTPGAVLPTGLLPSGLPSTSPAPGLTPVPTPSPTSPPVVQLPSLTPLPSLPIPSVGPLPSLPVVGPLVNNLLGH